MAFARARSWIISPWNRSKMSRRTLPPISSAKSWTASTIFCRIWKKWHAIVATNFSLHTGASVLRRSSANVSYRVDPSLPPGCYRDIPLLARLLIKLCALRHVIFSRRFEPRARYFRRTSFSMSRKGIEKSKGYPQNRITWFRAKSSMKPSTAVGTVYSALGLAFKDASEKLGALRPGTGMTRERWLLPLFQELGYGRLQTEKAFEIDE